MIVRGLPPDPPEDNKHDELSSRRFLRTNQTAGSHPILPARPTIAASRTRSFGIRVGSTAT